MSAADKQLINLTDQSTSLASPKDMVAFANTLKQFIVEQKLYSNIQGKNYVHVEAWQFTGASMGVVPIPKSTERILTDDPTEYKYRVEIELHRLDNDSVIGGGVAFCSNKERNKKTFEEYAVVSMAQTRAISKAYRNTFGWLMKVAGYEATPHEEMDGTDEKPTQEEPPRKVNVNDNAKFMNTKASDIAEYFIPEFPDIEAHYAAEETDEDLLKRAKGDINDMMNEQGIDNPVKKKSYVSKILKKSTIDSIEDARKVREVLEGVR